MSERELVFAHSATGRFLLNKTLRDLEARLDGATFVRVHKQAIINVDKVEVLESTGAGGTSARLTGGQAIPVSRRYAQPLRRMRRRPCGAHSTRRWMRSATLVTSSASGRLAIIRMPRSIARRAAPR